MMNRLFKAVLMMLVVVGLPGAAVAEPVYTDPQPYQVDPRYPFTLYPASYEMDNHYSWESDYPFDPELYYYPYEQQMIIEDEVRVTGGALSTESTGGSLISLSQGDIPEATRENVPPPVEQVPTPDEMQAQGTPYSKAYSRTQSFGNNIFGAGYSINASITSTEGDVGQEKTVEAFAEGKVFGTAFNNTKDLVLGRAQIHGQQGGANNGTAALYAMGQQIWSTNLYATFNPAPINWSRTFMSVSKTFMVGPVPISVKASLAGGVKLTVNGEIGPTVARLNATPGGWSNATASASVNIIVASFGVQGSLTLINATMPSTGEIFWPLCTINWTLRSNLALNTLSGQLDLYAKIRFLFFSKKWTVTIARWAGATYNWTLLNVNGTKELGFCSSGEQSAQEPLFSAQAY